MLDLERKTLATPRAGEALRPRGLLGVGIVGAGYWGPKLIRNFAASERAAVVAICDRDGERLKTVARSGLGSLPSTSYYQRFSELLADPRVDAVAIATPVHTHFELAKRALLSGRHVLIEKPLASSVAEAEELVELAERLGLTLLVDHTFLYHPAVTKLEELIRSGDLGELLYFDSVRINLGLFQPDINVLWDLAPHDLSILNRLVPSRPEAISATGASHWKKSTESIAYLSLTYPESFIAHVHVSWLAPVKVRQLMVSGTRKMAVYDDNQVLEKVKVYDRGIAEQPSTPEDVHRALVDYRSGDMVAPHIPAAEALAAEVEDFLDCVESSRQPRSDGRDGLAVVRLLECAQQSIERGGEPVALS